MAEAGFAKYELRNVTSELLARLVIDSRVLPGEDAAEAGLGCHLRIAVKVPHHARYGRRGHVDLVTIAEEGREHGCAGRTDGAVGARVRRVGCRDHERARAYAGLVSAGSGAGRNWAPF